MRKQYLKMVSVLSIAVVMTACGCEHDWKEADCLNPATCVLCEKTEGEPIGHDWKEATCAEPKTCSRCLLTEGNTLEHTWLSATCEEPKQCSVCDVTEGEALGHNWQDATCTEPQVCSVCKETKGAALGHTVESWTVTQEASCTEEGTEIGDCSVCGETIEKAIALKEHEASDWEITEMPTEYSEGVRVKKCIVCEKELETEKFSLSEEELKEMYKDKCQSISYKSLERTPGEYEGEYVKFSGKVVQVCSEASSSLYYSTYRVATSGNYDNVVYIYVDNYGSGSRILEDDWITFYGEFDGLYSYKAVRGNEITIPSVKVKYLE